MLSSCRRLLRKTNINHLHSENNRNPLPFYLFYSAKPWRDIVRHSFTAQRDAVKRIKEIVSSYRHWLLPPEVKRRNEEMERNVQNIYHVLRSRGPQAMENALAQLKVGLTEECVIKVLKMLCNDDVLLGLRFFDWAGRQKNYRHTGAAYYVLLKMLSQAKSTKLMLDWLDSFQKQENARGYRFYETLIMGYALAGKTSISNGECLWRKNDKNRQLVNISHRHYLFAGRSHAALQMFGRMRFQGFDLQRIGYNALLDGLVDEKCFDVVDVICKQISISRGHVNKSCSTDCIMLGNLCKQGKLDEARRLLCKIRENGSAVGIFISALCKEKRIDEARDLVEEVRKEGQVSSISKVYDAWIRGLVEEKKVDDALQYFEEARASQSFVPGDSCYNALVSGLLKKSRLEKFYNLQKNRLEKVHNLLNEMKKKLIFPDNCTMNELVCFFCQRKGMLDIALVLFNGISKMGSSPGNATYNALISALCRVRKLDEAHRILQDQIATGFTPSRQTFFDLVKSFDKVGKLDEMQDVIDARIKSQNVPSDTPRGTLISVLCNVGKVDDKVLVPRKMRRKNVLLNKNTYSVLILGFCVAKNAETASKLLLEMQEYGHHPSRYIFRTVIKVLCETGHSDRVIELLDMHVS
ncbi:hypothetical protein KI387_015170, partial [Taxus chinensis]